MDATLYDPGPGAMSSLRLNGPRVNDTHRASRPGRCVQLTAERWEARTKTAVSAAAQGVTICWLI